MEGISRPRAVGLHSTRSQAEPCVPRKVALPDGQDRALPDGRNPSRPTYPSLAQNPDRPCNPRPWFRPAQDSHPR